jgi:DNA-binding winged helix-turn-helix (wHTH) protein
VDHEAGSPAATLVRDSAQALVQSLLRRVYDAPELQFVRGVLLESMDGHAHREHEELLKTLEAYLTYGCSVLRTSRALGMHRNSVQHRLHRIRARLGLDLADPDARLLVQIALRGSDHARPETELESCVRLGDTIVDLQRRRATIAGRELRLTPTEVDLLRFFLAHPNTSLRSRTIRDAVWAPPRRPHGHTLHVHIRRLRTKLELDPNSPRCLVTDAGHGYRLVKSPLDGATNWQEQEARPSGPAG